MLLGSPPDKDKRQKGFTIIELLVATLVFSIVLIVVLSAFVQTSRLFYKGVNMDNTQESTRTITQDIADDIKFSQSAPTSFLIEYSSPTSPSYSSVTHSGRFCIGLHRYSYQLGQQTDGSGIY
jgi:prepilin-type N-terminal cleavage/methylation domain-containing protein